MSKEQTAVGFLMMMLQNEFPKQMCDIYESNQLLIEQITIQANQLEKDQHNETWNTAHQAGRFEGKGIAEENWQTFEDYWNE